MNLEDYKTEIEENNREALGPVIHIPDHKAYDNVRKLLDLSIDREVQKHLFKRVVGLTRIRELSLNDALRYNRALKNISEMEATDFICKAEFRHRDMLLKKLRKPGDDVEHIPKKRDFIEEAKANIREKIELRLRKKEADDKIHETNEKRMNDLFNLRSQKYPFRTDVFESPSRLIQEMSFEEFKRKRYKILKSGNLSFCHNKSMVTRNNEHVERTGGSKINKGPVTILPDAWFTMKDDGHFLYRRKENTSLTKADQEGKPGNSKEDLKRKGLNDQQIMNQLIKFAEESQKPPEDQMSELTEMSSSSSSGDEKEEPPENKTFMESLKVITRNRTGSTVARERFSILQAKELIEIKERNDALKKNSLTPSAESANEGKEEGKNNEGNEGDQNKDDDDASVVIKHEKKHTKMDIEAIEEADSSDSDSNSSSPSPSESTQQKKSSQPSSNPVGSTPARRSAKSSVKEAVETPQSKQSEPAKENTTPVRSATADRPTRRAQTSSSRDTFDETDSLRKSAEGATGRKMPQPSRRRMLLTDKSEDSAEYTQESEVKRPAIMVYQDENEVPTIVNSKTPTFKGNRILRNRNKDSGSGIPFSYSSTKYSSQERTSESPSLVRYSNQSREIARKKLLENKRKAMEGYRLDRSFDESQRRVKTQLSESMNISRLNSRQCKRPGTTATNRRASPLDQSLDQLYQRLDDLKVESKEGLEALNFEKWKADFRHKNQQDTMHLLSELSETKGKTLELMYLYNKSNQIHEKKEGDAAAKEIQNRDTRLEKMISQTYRRGILEDLKKVRQQRIIFRKLL